MIFPVDIHTHRLPPVPGTAIANRYPDTFVPEEGAWYSVGIHPWHIPATVTPVVRNEMNVLASLAGHPQVLAIEAGLDKLADARWQYRWRFLNIRRGCLWSLEAFWSFIW